MVEGSRGALRRWTLRGSYRGAQCRDLLFDVQWTPRENLGPPCNPEDVPIGVQAFKDPPHPPM